MNHLSFYWLPYNKENILKGLESEFCKLVEKSIRSNNIALPPIPDVVLEIQQLCTSESTTIKDIADLLLQDPSLAASVIRVANSAVFNRRNITCLDLITAVSRLGICRVRDIVTAQAIEQLKHSVNLNKECNALLRKSASSSREFAAVMVMVCQSIQKHSEPSENQHLEIDKALLVGLLADIGLFCLVNEYYSYGDKGNYLDIEIAKYIFSKRCSATSRLVLHRWHFDNDFLEVASNRALLSKTGNTVSYLDIARMASHLLMFRNQDEAIEEHEVEVTAVGAEALYELSNLTKTQFTHNIKEIISFSGL